MKIYSATIPVMSPVQRLSRRFVLDLAAACQTRLRKHLVAPVDHQLTLYQRGLEEIVESARVHLARVTGELGGEIHRPHHLLPLVLALLAGPGELAIAALLGGDVDHYRSRAPAFHRGARD